MVMRYTFNLKYSYVKFCTKNQQKYFWLIFILIKMILKEYSEIYHWQLVNLHIFLTDINQKCQAYIVEKYIERYLDVLP